MPHPSPPPGARPAAPSAAIDALNVGLIVVALALAFRIPFELLLSAYALLGPAHYVTEIKWLEEKRFFVRSPGWVAALVALSLAASAPLLLELPACAPLRQGLSAGAGQALQRVTAMLPLAALLFAIGLCIWRRAWQLGCWLAASLLLSYAVVAAIPFSMILFGVFLPTVVHVYLFTWLFMLSGALRSRSGWGLAGAALLALVPVVIALSAVDPARYGPSERTQAEFAAGDFPSLIVALALVVAPFRDGPLSLLSPLACKIQIFLAFAYTYHYLNWFSKTSIIGWNRDLSVTRCGIMGGIWLATVALYAHDYKLGFSLLFFLSILHVFLEFPLNVTSIRSLAGLLTGREPTPAN